MNPQMIRRWLCYPLGIFRFLLWRFGGHSERRLHARIGSLITQLDRLVFYRTAVLPGRLGLGLSTLPDGSKIIHPLHDMAVLDEIWIENVYEKDRKVESGDVVMDCGAHVGTFSVKAATRGAQIVVAIEPDPTNYALLRRNIRLNKLDNIVVICAAVGGREMAQRTKCYWKDRLTARVRTIRSLASELGLESLDFLKIDVEGDEVDVMEGAEGVDVKNIALEYHGELTRTQAERLLRLRGYCTDTREGPDGIGYVYARTQSTG